MKSKKNLNRSLAASFAFITCVAAVAGISFSFNTNNTKNASAVVTGDVNSDSKVDVTDIVRLQKYLLKEEELDKTSYENADINGDGTVNAKDLTILKKQVNSTSSGKSSTTTTTTADAGGNIAAAIEYLGSSVKLYDADGNELASADNVMVDGATATITVPGSYDVSGESSEGQLIVNVDKTAYPKSVDGNTVDLTFKGLTLSNSTKAPVYIESIDDECVISVKKGTENTISDGTSHTDTYVNSDNETKTINAAIYSKDDLKIKGKGTLTVNGNTEDGIVSTNDLKIFNGTVNVNAVDDGIRGNDSVKIGDKDDLVSNGGKGDFSNLNLTVKTTKSGDGIKSTSDDDGDGTITINGGTININAYADGIQAEQDFTMNGGDLKIYTYQGSSFTGTASSSTGGWGMQDGGNSNKPDISAKGIKSVGVYDSDGTTLKTGGTININAGNISIDSSDDSIHSSGDITLNAGKLNLKSSDDAVHSDSSLYIGGTTAGEDYTSLEVYAAKCYEGMEAVYIYQNNGNIYINSDDDGYNAAGGSDSSGNNNNTGFDQHGFGGGGMSSSFGEMNLAGGIVVCNAASGDHDAFDSNGNLTFTGGFYIANGSDALDKGDGNYTCTNNGAAIITMNGGNSNLDTRYTFTDSNGNIIASVLSASGGSYGSYTSNMDGFTLTTSKDGVNVYSGGTISDGKSISTLGQGDIYTSGTISGGTSVTTSSGGGRGGNQGGFSMNGFLN